MRLASALLLLGLLGGAAAAGRHLTAPTPTQALNAQASGGRSSGYGDAAARGLASGRAGGPAGRRRQRQPGSLHAAYCCVPSPPLLAAEAKASRGSCLNRRRNGRHTDASPEGPLLRPQLLLPLP